MFLVSEFLLVRGFFKHKYHYHYYTLYACRFKWKLVQLFRVEKFSNSPFLRKNIFSYVPTTFETLNYIIKDIEINIFYQKTCLRLQIFNLQTINLIMTFGEANLCFIQLSLYLRNIW